jgi:predicted membrane-bound spermidine synthase
LHGCRQGVILGSRLGIRSRQAHANEVTFGVAYIRIHLRKKIKYGLKSSPARGNRSPLVPLRQRIFVAILILGAYSQILQAMLIREGLVVFYGNEVSLGAFYGSWLFWLAAGSMLVIWLRQRRWARKPLPSLRRLLLLLPLVLALQILALRSARFFLTVSSSEFVPLGELFLSLFLVTSLSGLLIGVAFPLAFKAVRNAIEDDSTGVAVGLVSRLYVADALGALAGGVLFTFVLLRWLGTVETLGILTLALGLTVWSLYDKLARQGWIALSLGVAGLVLAMAPAAPWLDRALEELRFATLQPGLELVDAVETRYGHVAVGRLGDQYSVVADGQIRDSFPLPREVAREAAFFSAQADGPKRVLIFGGFASGLPAELLRYPVQRIDVVEEDRRAFEEVQPFLTAESRKALKDPRLALHFQDGRRYVNQAGAGARYDLVLVLSAAPSSAYSNRYFTRDFYRQVRKLLSPDGVFCTQVSGASHYLGREVGSYTGSVYRTLGQVFAHIAIVPGDVQVFCASPAPDRVSEEPAELERRYLALPLDEHRFPAASFYSLLPAEEISYVHDRLEEAKAEINTDERPVTYYLNMVLWGKLSASGFVDWLQRVRGMGPWPYLLAPILIVGLWLLRSGMEGFQRPALQRRGATFVLVMLGAIAMAAELAVLFGYQSQVGFMFERVALLNGLFMTGLALGAGGGTWLARRAPPVATLVLVALLVAGGLALLPPALGALGSVVPTVQELGYPGLALAAGLLTGTGFPLGVHLAQQDLGEVVQSGGIALAADNLGGAIGGLVTGALMVPLLGVEATCRVLAVLALLALVPLLFARLAPDAIAASGERTFKSFPWSGLGWSLIFAVLLVYGWQLLERGVEPGPRVQFDDTRLAQVSGSERFELSRDPFPYYRGFEEGGSRAETVSLSSMAAAPEVKGFAGPINVLLSVDQEGKLRGLSYLESKETPSYIAGIEQWLDTLVGTDLASGALSSERVDAMSGATVSSRAVLEAVNRSARRATESVFGKPLPPLEPVPSKRLDLAFWATLALLLTFFPVYVSGREGARLAFQVATLLVLGIWLNTPITEIDLVNLSLGHAAPPWENPQRWLLLGFIGVTSILFGQVWCGYLCPFGALQELTSRLGWYLGLRSYPDRRIDQRARWLKFLLLTFVLIAVWVSGESTWASFDPMQHAFGGRLAGWMLVLVIVVLLGSLFYVRFWCRYFCPMGAFLAMGNKVALLQRLAPKRRFEHCDLGVRGEFDLDCIRCSRCISGKDTRVRHHPHLKQKKFK